MLTSIPNKSTIKYLESSTVSYIYQNTLVDLVPFKKIPPALGKETVSKGELKWAILNLKKTVYQSPLNYLRQHQLPTDQIIPKMCLIA